MSKLTLYNKNFSSPAQITDEVYIDLGASAVILGEIKRAFKGGADMVIRTASGGGGTLLVENTDYTLEGIDTRLTAEAPFTVYSTVTITNVTFQTGNLYFTYKAVNSYIDADWANTLQESSSGFFRQMLLNGDFRIAQERTSSSVNTNYLFDQWFHSFTVGGGVTWTQDATFNFSPSEYSSKVVMTSAVVGNFWRLIQPIPAYRSSPYFGKTAQFQLKIEQASITAGSQTVKVDLYCPSAKDDISTLELLESSGEIVLDGTKQELNIEFDLSGNTSSGYNVKTGLYILIEVLQAGATGTSTVYIGDVQINEGDVLLPFQPRNDKAELDTFFHEVAMFGIAESTSLLPVSGNFKTEMFGTPIVASFDSTPGIGSTGGEIGRVGIGGVAVTITATPGDKNGFDWITFSGTPLVVGEAYVLRMRLDARIA